MIAIGKEIKNKRIEKQLTQEKLASILGCKRANISNIETGKIYPSLQLLIKINKILDLEIDKIFEKKPQNN